MKSWKASIVLIDSCNYSMLTANLEFINKKSFCFSFFATNVIRVKRREIQTLHCSKWFAFFNAYSVQVSIWTHNSSNLLSKILLLLLRKRCRSFSYWTKRQMSMCIGRVYIEFAISSWKFFWRVWTKEISRIIYQDLPCSNQRAQNERVASKLEQLRILKTTTSHWIKNEK
jgi:hypothetical protein